MADAFYSLVQVKRAEMSSLFDTWLVPTADLIFTLLDNMDAFYEAASMPFDNGAMFSPEAVLHLATVSAHLRAKAFLVAADRAAPKADLNLKLLNYAPYTEDEYSPDYSPSTPPNSPKPSTSAVAAAKSPEGLTPPPKAVRLYSPEK